MFSRSGLAMFINKSFKKSDTAEKFKYKNIDANYDRKVFQFENGEILSNKNVR